MNRGSFFSAPLRASVQYFKYCSKPNFCKMLICISFGKIALNSFQKFLSLNQL